MQNRKRKGFTLIELLIVVVIIGILAAIAIPKFANTKEKAYLATMKGDLRNLATAQEGYSADAAGAYFAGTCIAGGTTCQGYSPSTGVEVAVTQAAPAGAEPSTWTGTATHGQTGKACFIWSGNTAPATPTYRAAVSGEPKCQ